MIIHSLKIIFTTIFLSMLCVTTWASLNYNLFAVLPELLKDPWTVATLFDAYFGFLTFYLWVFYKESDTQTRILWFIAIMALGNIAISLYIMIQLFKLPEDAAIEQLLLKNKPRLCIRN